MAEQRYRNVQLLPSVLHKHNSRLISRRCHVKQAAIVMQIVMFIRYCELRGDENTSHKARLQMT